MALIESGTGTIEAIGGPHFNARMAMSVVDEIITKVYLPFRGAEGFETERAVLVAPPHAEHRENDAEHSWSVGFTSLVFYDLREELGLELTPDFDIGLALAGVQVHDVIEVPAGDVNAMTHDPNLIALKSIREQAAIRYFEEDCLYLGKTMERWQEYDRKDFPEAQYVSDIDKILACRIIFLDGGRKWHDWEGQITSRSVMVTRMRAKILTDMGHKLFDVLEIDLENKPEVFPRDETIDYPYQLVIPEVEQVK